MQSSHPQKTSGSEENVVKNTAKHSQSLARLVTSPSRGPLKSFSRNTMKAESSSPISKVKSNKVQAQSLLSLLRARNEPHSANESKGSNSNTIDHHAVVMKHVAQSPLDIIGKDWLNAPRQHNVIKNKESHDRFIPDRNTMDAAASHFILSNKSDSDFSDRGDLNYEEQVAEACGIVPGQRILSFRTQPPVNGKEGLRRVKGYSLTTVATSVQRRILTSPEKILDAPYMADDYYLNLLDWSSRNVVAVGLDRSVYLWNAENGTIRPLKQANDDPITSLSWSLDGIYLAVGTSSGDTQVWDVEANIKLRSMDGQQCRVGALSWNKFIVSSGARDGTIWHHDVRIPEHKIARLIGHEDEVCGLKWRGDGVLLASGGNDNTVNVWDARSTTPKFTKHNHVSAVKAIAWCPWNNNLLASGGGRGDKHIHFWNTATTARVNSINTGSQVTSLIWSRHYKEIMSSHGFPNNQLTIWSYPTLNKIIDIPGHDSRILHTALSPDGQVVASVASDENLKFWRIFENDGKDTLSANTRLTMFNRTNSLR